MFRRSTLLTVSALTLGSLAPLAAQQTTTPPTKPAPQQQTHVRKPATQHTPAAKPAAARTWTIEQIREVQRALTGLKLYAGPATGTMTLETRRAIRTFQHTHSLPVTGRLSDSLLVLLKAPSPAK